MSEIIRELRDNYNEMSILIEKQTFSVKDANFYMKRYFNVLRKMEQLEESRDKLRMRNEKLKKLVADGKGESKS